MDLAKAIKQLSAQVNVDAIESRDLAKELEKLYRKVDDLEKHSKEQQETIDRWTKRCEKAETERDRLVTEYKEPFEFKKQEMEEEIERVKKVEEGLERDSFQWRIERQYMIRECKHLRELLSCLNAKGGGIDFDMDWPTTVSTPNDQGYSQSQTDYRKISVKPQPTVKPDLE